MRFPTRRTSGTVMREPSADGPFIAFSPPLIGAEDIAEVVETLQSGWITAGPRVEKFERSVAEYIGAAHAVAVYSCTSAMHLALVALGIGPGDEVIVPTMTFASTAHVVCHAGATPVFVDCEPDTLNLDPAGIEERITPRTRAIIPMHYGGHPCDMDRIWEIGQRRGLFVLEDAAHAIGAKHRDTRIGGRGGAACFSFYATKNMTTAEGGMLVTADAALARRVRVLSMYGIDDAREIWAERYSRRGSWDYDVVELGFKCNMTDLQAALGLHQLVKLDGFIEARRRRARIYDQALSRIDGVRCPVVRAYADPAWHLYPFQLPLGVSRDKVLAELRRAGVGTSVLWKPLHLHTYYRKRFGVGPGDFPAAEAAFERLINLPISPATSEPAIAYAAKTLADILGN